MCEPMSTSMVVATSLMAAASAASAAGTIQQSQATASVAKYNARVAQKNAYAQESVQRRQAKSKIASQTVALGGQGTRVDTGSSLDLLSESARNAELDALATRYSGVSQANSLKAQASNSLTGGLFGAGAELLGGASKIGLMQLQPSS